MDAAKILRKAQRILQRIAPLIRDHPQVPTLFVKEFRDPPREMQLKAIDYLSMGQLKWIADWLEANKSPKGAAPKYGAKMAAEDLAEFYRDNLGKPHWETIARIILEEFPDAQKKNGAKQSKSPLADWMRQLAKRR